MLWGKTAGNEPPEGDQEAAEPVEALQPDTSPISGIVLDRVIARHKSEVWFASWSPDGKSLVTSSKEAIYIHHVGTGESIKVYSDAREKKPRAISWSQDNSHIAIAESSSIHIYDTRSRKTVKSIRSNWGRAQLLEFSPAGRYLAAAHSALDEGPSVVIIWDTVSGVEKAVISELTSMAASFLWSGTGDKLYIVRDRRSIFAYDVSGGQSTELLIHLEKAVIVGNIVAFDKYFALPIESYIEIWNIESKEAVIVLEGHISDIISLCVSKDGRILVSKSKDGTIKLWRSDRWEEIATIPETAGTDDHGIGISFNPRFPYLVSRAKGDTAIRIWKVDIDDLLRQASQNKFVRYTTAKIVLVGDSGVGKTTLGWRLTHDAYKEHESSHGQQFWVVNEFQMIRKDGTTCEVVIWDMAGQPDYRLVHSLYLDNVDLGLLLFDPTVRQDPLNAPLFWLRHLHPAQNNKCPVILVGTRTDRGLSTHTDEELGQFCATHDVSGGFIKTSAKTTEGLAALVERIKSEIRWDDLTATVTTATFKRIKEFVLAMKADPNEKNVLVAPDVLEAALKSTDKRWRFIREEMMTAIRNLENHGYVTILKSSKGETYILMTPELLANLASSFVLEARRNEKGLGVLEENGLLGGRYKFPELDGLAKNEREVLLDAVTVLFLQHTLCFRENFNDESFLVFPSLINEKRPVNEHVKIEEDVFYRVTGPVENVFASLVVLLGYTNTFIRNNQWQNQAQYQLGDGEICGFKQVSSREGELEMELYYAVGLPPHVKSLFRGLFERFLSLKDLDILQYQPVSCQNCNERLARTVVVQQLEKGRTYSFCPNCGEMIDLPPVERLKQLVRVGEANLNEEQAVALRRTAFEAAIVRIKGISRQNGDIPGIPKCFISYAWDYGKHDQWVHRLAIDLKKAGIEVLLDRWNNPPGGSISTFIDLILAAEFVIVVGTPLLKQKYEDKQADAAVAAEQKLINTRLIHVGEFGKKVIPILLEGTPKSAFTPLLRDVVRVDFRNEPFYFYNLFSVIVRLYQISFDNPFLVELHDSLKPGARPRGANPSDWLP